MGILTIIYDFIIHIDTHLGIVISQYGVLVYAILFTIIFAETGFVLTPFLPGDSLLFAAGTFAAIGSFNIFILLFILWSAAFLGDTANYWIGRYFGQKLLDSPRIPINHAHIERMQKFYDENGGKTIFIARFLPILRTFAPFVAGVGKMNYKRFVSYNATGGFVWVFGFTLLGYFFGNIPIIKDNFSVMIIIIIMLSVIPMSVEYTRARSRKKASQASL